MPSNKSEPNRPLVVVVTGASGSGKTAILPELQRLLPGVAVLDKDHMWARDWGQAYDNFFRMAHALARGGIPLVIVGTIIPEHFEGYGCQEVDTVDIRWINVHCSDEIREARLRSRPAWRKSSSPGFIEEHRSLARRLLDSELPEGAPMVDTSSDEIDDSARAVADLVKDALAS
jgi:hypothetical protein